MRIPKLFQLIAFCYLFSVFGCNSEAAKSNVESESNTGQSSTGDNHAKLFHLLSASTTGVQFDNELIETNEINFFRFQYLYNGGGVGIGDINNDGLADLYFTGTIADDKLYLNEGNMRFTDITKSAGILKNQGVKTGVSMVDINADGYLDIYVSRTGWYKDPAKRANLLYINQGDNTFVESAKDFGLAETGNTVQAAFFDFDRDGDLDCYMANHPLFRLPNVQWENDRRNPPDRFRDKLYRNNGDNTFTEISKESGINNLGHGLGLAISDFNQDGWPDVYVANDFRAHDFYYINNGNGTFTEKAKLLTSHVSYFSMGSDVADINNDGQLDLFVVEMLAEDNKRQKTNMANMNPELFWDMVNSGYHYQFMRNTLQLNNGNGAFSEIAYLSELTNTDWSWAPLFADFDLDGLKDLAITNGYLRDTQDKDYNKKANKLVKEKKVKSDEELTALFSELSELMNTTRLKNYVYKNEGDLRFSNQSEDWGFDFAGFSNGMAYGDLDNDGDLDLVVNNMNDPASIYKNTSIEKSKGHYLLVDLVGPKQNLNGLGAKLTLTTSIGKQFQEFWVSRGFESSCDQKVHFGIAKGDKIQELKVEWPDGKIQLLENIKIDQEVQLEYKNARAKDVQKIRPAPFFVQGGKKGKYLFTHRENDYDDYEKEILLPHKQSQNGPRIAVGDVNGDGREDFYIGGAAGQTGMLIIQLEKGQFASSSAPTFQLDKESEDIDALFFDYDNDGDLDLYVVSGGNEFDINSPLLQDRLYLNNGRGIFNKLKGVLPKMACSGGTVSASDFDNDGDLDLFVGGRITPAKYPLAPRSYILRNERGRFIDVTSTVCSDLIQPGLITSSVWSDFNNDGSEDLIIVGEWTGIMLFQNNNGQLKNVSEKYGLDQESGWWNKIIATDLDNDGDDDYVLGNLGLNYKYKASKEEPFEIYAHDFDDNGKLDIVLGYYNDGICYPVRGRQCSSEQMPMIAEKFEDYEEFGEAGIEEVYGSKLKDAVHYKAHNFASIVLLNNGPDGFAIKSLPTMAQISPINGIIAADFDKNGTTDLLVAGNLYQAEVETGRADAGRGLLMLGDGKGTFDEVPIQESGINAPMDVKDLKLLRSGPNEPNIILVANNNFGMQLFFENIARSKKDLQ